MTCLSSQAHCLREVAPKSAHPPVCALLRSTGVYNRGLQPPGHEAVPICGTLGTRPPSRMWVVGKWVKLHFPLLASFWFMGKSSSMKPVPGAKRLECAVLRSLQSCPTLCNPKDCSRQAPLSMGFSRQEYWNGLPFPPPGDLPVPGIKPTSCISRQVLCR